MKEKVPEFKKKSEAWVLSEIKGTFIVCFQKYLEYRSGYIEATQIKNIDPLKAKSDMIAALDAYFQTCQAPFIPFILDVPDKIIELMKESGVKLEECDNVNNLRMKYETLPQNGMKYTPELLFFMGNILTKWNMEQGYFRMLENYDIYDTFEDRMKAIEDEEEN